MPPELKQDGIIVCSKSYCRDCESTKSFLKKSGIPFHEVNLQESPEVLDTVKELGYSSAPVVFDNVRGKAWAGFNYNELKETKQAFSNT